MKKILNIYCKLVKYRIILIVDFKIRNLNCAIIFGLQIELIAKFTLTITLKNTIQYLVENFIKIFLKLRSFKVCLLLFTKLLY